MADLFRFKKFSIRQDLCAMKVGTDGVLLGAWASGGQRILDIGCGTGVISLMLAQRYPESRITAIDIVEDCCRQTRQNADLTEWGSRVETLNVSLQDYVAQNEGKVFFDAIVSNPPFFVGSMKNPDIFRSLARHSDSLPFSALARGVERLLSPEGLFSAILPDENFRDFCEEAWFSGLYLVKDVAIKTTKKKPVKRHLLLFGKKHGMNVGTTVETLQNADGARSEWYREITEEFYL